MNMFSAQQVLNTNLKTVFTSFAILYVFALFIHMQLVIYSTLIFFNCIYAFIALYRLWLFINAPTKRRSLDKYINKNLPRYTILVPLYKESEVVTALAKHLATIHYPKALMQILLIVEEDDALTINAINSLILPAFFQMIKVPYSHPRTKAKACNYALKYADGELITIYDAEDRPDLNQLLKAATIFKSAPKSLACLQAELCFYNKDENLLTRMFAIEYKMLFGYILPSQTKFGMPIPLGGTSNHFQMHIIKELGGWDPYNVTEDAELGLRIKLGGYEIGMLPSETEEECVIDLAAWMNQRARWIKGHLHTYLCYLRAPLQVFKTFGVSGSLFITYALFLTPICLITTPLIVLYAIIAYFFLEPNLFYFYLAWMNLFMCGICLFVTAFIAAYSLESKAIQKATALFPLYMILHVFAAIMAIKNLVISPHTWHKTKHGKSRFVAN